MAAAASRSAASSGSWSREKSNSRDKVIAEEPSTDRSPNRQGLWARASSVTSETHSSREIVGAASGRTQRRLFLKVDFRHRDSGGRVAPIGGSLAAPRVAMLALS